MVVRRLLLAAAVGALLGWGLGWLQFYGYLTAWRPLPAAPAPLTALARADAATIYAQAADGALYACAYREPHCWVAVSEPDIGERSSSIHPIPCGDAAAAFALTAQPPPGIRACAASREIYADGTGMFLFALADDRQVWHWRWIRSPYDRSPAGSIVPGAVVGLLVAGAWAGLRAGWRRLRGWGARGS